MPILFQSFWRLCNIHYVDRLCSCAAIIMTIFKFAHDVKSTAVNHARQLDNGLCTLAQSSSGAYPAVGRVTSSTGNTLPCDVTSTSWKAAPLPLSPAGTLMTQPTRPCLPNTGMAVPRDCGARPPPVAQATVHSALQQPTGAPLTEQVRRSVIVNPSHPQSSGSFAWYEHDVTKPVPSCTVAPIYVHV